MFFIRMKYYRNIYTCVYYIILYYNVLDNMRHRRAIYRGRYLLSIMIHQVRIVLKLVTLRGILLKIVLVFVGSNDNDLTVVENINL